LNEIATVFERVSRHKVVAGYRRWQQRWSAKSAETQEHA